MEKVLSILLSAALLLALAACGGGGNGAPTQEAPDLNKYYEDFMASLGEDAPMTMDPQLFDYDNLVDQYYPGLHNYEMKQLVTQQAAISAVAFEMALVEVENAGDAQAVADIFQARIDRQIEDGAFYPLTVESWEKAQIITHGNVVALICAGDQQSQAVEAFNKLFS